MVASRFVLAAHSILLTVVCGDANSGEAVRIPEIPDMDNLGAHLFDDDDKHNFDYDYDGM